MEEEKVSIREFKGGEVRDHHVFICVDVCVANDVPYRYQ